jgi:protocatechuate 3,4-dioxygenase beta subunit
MASGPYGKRVVLVVVVAGILGVLAMWIGKERSPTARKGVATVVRASRFAPEPGDDRQAATASLEGVVTKSNGGPVRGAIVVATRARGPDTPPYQVLRPAAAATTSNDGRFSFAGLSPGDYGVTATAAGFAPGERSPVKLVVGSKTNVTIQLSAGGFTLSGHVLDAGGGVVSGATVRATFYGGGGRIPRFYQTTSDPGGAYNLRLDRGSYGLWIEAEGYAPVRDGVTIARDETRDLRLLPAARLYGRVVERATHQPVADAEVWLVTERRSDQPPPRDVKTDDEGKFAFNDLPPGTFSVAARKARLVGYSRMTPVSAMQAVTDVEVDLEPGLSVRGRTVDGKGGGLGGVRLSLYKRDPPFDRGAWAASESTGTFALEGVLSGRYSLSTIREGFSPVRQDVTVGAKDVEGLVVKLAQGAVVTGVVVGSDGKPVASAQVGASLSMKMGTGGRMQTGRGERTDEEGKFEFKDIEPSEVTLHAKHADHGAATADAFTIREGEKKDVRIVLGAGASIIGKVRFDDGTPAAGIQVFGYQRGSGSAGRSDNDVTTADGSFKLGGLGAGATDVSARRDYTTSPKSTTVSLSEGEKKDGVEIEIPKGGLTIGGQVIGPDGAPIVGATVTASQERDGRAMRVLGNPFAGRAFLSSEGGNFTIEDVPKGNYTLTAFHSSHPEGEAKGVAAGATGVRVQLPAEASVSGVVVDADGRPVTDYTIAVMPGPAAKESSAEQARRISMSAMDNPIRRIHEPEGTFALDRLRAGAFELKVTTADGRSGSTVATLAAGEKRTGVRITLAGGVRIVGRIVDLDTGAPIEGATVSAQPVGVPSMPDGAKTAADGTFRLENVVSDQPLRVFAAVDGYVNDGRNLDPPKGKTEVDVGAIKLMRGDMQIKFGPGQQGYTGFGVINRDGHPVVSTIQKGSPAEKAALQTGDAILAVDGRDARELGPTSVQYLLVGKPGSSVSVQVQPHGEEKPRTVTLTRVDRESLAR